MKRVLEKNKYIVYNEDKKVLVFTSIENSKLKISIPSDNMSYNYVDQISSFHSSIKKLLINNEAVFLDKSIDEMPIFETENCKLKKSSLQMIRNYYTLYREFSEKDYEGIMLLCNKYHFKPHLLTIEELKKIIITGRKAYNIDRCMYASLEELEKRLKFIKY